MIYIWEQEGAGGRPGGKEGSPRAGGDWGGWTQIPPAATCLASLWGWWRRPHASSQATDILISVPQVLSGRSLKLVLIHGPKKEGPIGSYSWSKDMIG